MKLLIIRHGDPDYEHDNVTEKGKREVELLGQRLAKENITKIYCSPLGRARATAAPTCRLTGTEPEILDWLREFPAPDVKVDYTENGVCPWNLAPSFWTKFPEHFTQEWWRSPVYAGTGIREIAENVWDSFDALIASLGYVRDGLVYHVAPEYLRGDDRTFAFFCHLGLGNCLLSHIAGVPLPQWWHTVFLPTSSVTTVYMEKHLEHRADAIGRIASIGDTSHLYAGGEPVSKSGLHWWWN